MVRITRQKVQQQARRGGRHGLRAKLLEKDSLVGAVAVLGVGLVLVSYVLWTTTADDSHLRSTQGTGGTHPDLHLKDQNAEQYNAIALDILQQLDCHKLLNTTRGSSGGGGDGSGDSFDLSEGEGVDSEVQRRRRRRRLEEEMPGAPNDDVERAFEQDGGGGGADEEEGGNDAAEDEDGEINNMEIDDDVQREEFSGNNYDEGTWKNPTAKHLFCLAAFASSDDTETGEWKDSITCDATGKAQIPLLDLWAMAMAEMDSDLLLKILDMSVETFKTVVKKDMHLWAPRDDTGLEYMVTHVNDDTKTVDQGGLYGLEQSMGPGKVFVDVGSCLGTTSMAIALLYPYTRVISIEVASPNWLLQEMNFRCNADSFADTQMPVIMLAGVGPTHATTTSARYMWKPDQVTAARAWTPQEEIKPDMDIELHVKLRPWHSILAEAEIEHDQVTNQAHIDVLNVDCGACEYNLIPSMTDTEFDSITTVMGGVHWGYIPEQKLPSSSRGKETHERLCRHENFARTAKECCEFPNMEVISSYPGHVLVKEGDKKAVGQAGTVADVAGELCENYSTWAVEKHVHDIQTDWGWFQLTPSAMG